MMQTEMYNQVILKSKARFENNLGDLSVVDPIALPHP